MPWPVLGDGIERTISALQREGRRHAGISPNDTPERVDSHAELPAAWSESPLVGVSRPETSVSKTAFGPSGRRGGSNPPLSARTKPRGAAPDGADFRAVSVSGGKHRFLAHELEPKWSRRDGVGLGSGGAAAGDILRGLRAVSSAGERPPHTREVTGSIPVLPITEWPENRGICPVFTTCVPRRRNASEYGTVREHPRAAPRSRGLVAWCAPATPLSTQAESPTGRVSASAIQARNLIQASSSGAGNYRAVEVPDADAAVGTHRFGASSAGSVEDAR